MRSDARRVRPGLFVVLAICSGLAWADTIEVKRPEERAGWLDAVAERIVSEEYGFTARGPRGFSAPNRAQDLRATLGPAGLQVTSRAPAASPEGTWELRLTPVAWGRTPSLSPLPDAAPRAMGNRATFDRGVITEWYMNDDHGLEQGFTIASPPAGGDPGADLVLEIAIGGTVVGHLADSARGVVFADAGGRPVARYAGLSVADASGSEIPARLELAPGLIRIVVQDRDASYPLTIDPLLTSPSWTTESNQTSASYGISVATAGDVDGDGYSDFLVGAFLYDNGQTDEGRVFLYTGGPFGPSSTPAWTFESNQVSALAGFASAGAGDVNGDGYDDVIVGAYLYDNGQTDEGAAWVFLGSPAGLSATPSWIAEGNQAGAYFGYSVSTAGDVNGDGYDDVIVGAHLYDNGQTDEGAAWVYLGSASGLEPAPSWMGEGNLGNAYFGYSVAPALDTNGDGYDDIIVGASGYTNGQTQEGAAFVYLGSASGLSATASWTGEPNTPTARFGWSVAGVGDVNGDGYADVVMGGPFWDNPAGYTNEGLVYLYYGTPAGPSPTRASFNPNPFQLQAYIGLLGGRGRRRQRRRLRRYPGGRASLRQRTGRRRTGVSLPRLTDGAAEPDLDGGDEPGGRPDGDRRGHGGGRQR